MKGHYEQTGVVVISLPDSVAITCANCNTQWWSMSILICPMRGYLDYHLNFLVMFYSK